MTIREHPFRIRYDPQANAAYIYIVEGGSFDRTVTVDPLELGGMINLDLDTDGRLRGIEILGARTFLNSAILGPE